MRSKLLPILTTCATLAIGAAPANALPSSCTATVVITCFGQDVTPDPGLASVPLPAMYSTSTSAEADFQLLIGMGNYDTESFESPFTDKQAGPLNIFQGGLSLSGVLTDSVEDGGRVRAAPLDDAINRGFPTDMNQFWKNETSDDPGDELFRVAFYDGGSPLGVRSFGFYATAWGTLSDPGATNLVLDLIFDGAPTITVGIPHDQSGNTAGSVFYFGVISDAPFIAAALRNSTGEDGDVMGFDDFTVAIVPEPSTGLLLGAGLLVFAAIRRRRDA